MMQPPNTMKGVGSFAVLFHFSMLVLHASADVPHIYYDWTVSFSHRAPFGVEKQVIVINDQFPGPLLNAATNDMVNINVHNKLTEPLLMTWNGVQLRRNSWQDGVQETNCPILPGKNWTYSFQVKDQIGSFFYFPSLLFQKAAGGYGPIRLNNRADIPIPFPQPDYEYDVLIGDWYDASYKDLRNALENGDRLTYPDGILINGLGPKKATFDFEPGATYRLRISNVGLKTTLNFMIQDHELLLVETEGSYTLKVNYDNIDIHVGQSFSVLVRALDSAKHSSFYMVAASRFIPYEHYGLGIVRYNKYEGEPLYPIFPIPRRESDELRYSVEQAESIRLDLAVGAARPNPQGSFHYGSINISRTIILENGLAVIQGKYRFTINGRSFMHPDTPLKLADYFQLPGVFEPGTFPDVPPSADSRSRMSVSVIEANYHDFLHLVFQNPLPAIQSWHADGHSFFVVGYGAGTWDKSKMDSYNMVDAIYRATVQVYPQSWTAILIKLDNLGMWNLRSEDAERLYLGQELYLRVKSDEGDPSKVSPRDEEPIPANAIKCGRAL